MNTVTLTSKAKPELFLEADNITPDIFAGKTNEQIAALTLYEGSAKHPLGEYYDVSGSAGPTAAETRIVIKGDATRLKYVGMKMTGGEISIEGNADMYVGAWMKGGKIQVKGSVDAFAGTGMTGGEISIDGDAGNYLGAAYRGDWRGMRGGVIRVKGNAGSDLGYFMNGGTIVVGGNADVHVGTHAEGNGKIIIKGNAKSKVGGQMVGGEIYIFGDLEVPMPTFEYRKDVELEVDGTKAKFALFEGDTAERHPKRKGETVFGKIYMKY
ncbi:MAG TPA: formylmethanofuran dehydrogenase subunit C [Methanomicrobiales archaeon]|nr:formylmethanofuran dehydrogenase subunit C [Methanomicrobiales archaeon]